MRLVLFAIALSLGGAARASETRMLAPGAPSPPATIGQLAWLAGSWKGVGLGAAATEVYSAPEGGQIAGHFTLVEAGKLHFYELMQIVPRGRSLVYRLRHFNADLTGWEDAKAGKGWSSRLSRSRATPSSLPASRCAAPGPIRWTCGSASAATAARRTRFSITAAARRESTGHGTEVGSVSA